MGEIVSYLAMRVHQKLGILGEIPRQRLHEGDRNRIIREDGTVEETVFHLSSLGSLPFGGNLLLTGLPRCRAACLVDF
jgi:sirohydrochlorin ferrochelatase